jgi:predicted transcriptional regulator
MAKKREHLEVIRDILAVIRDNKNSLGPTRLLHHSNLSPQMFKEYVQELLDKKLIQNKIDGNKITYSLTDRGFEFLAKYTLKQDFIENFGL